MTSIRHTLAREMGKQTLISIGIYALLFIVLYAIEQFFAWEGRLLPWDDAAFIVGIPASVLGTAYVLTIKNPNNYLGFYMGIGMSILLACQFGLLGQYDLTVLYMVIFIPFMVTSLLTWRKQTLAVEQKTAPLRPAFIERKAFMMTVVAFIAIMVIDYVIATRVMNHDGWGDAWLIKVLSGAMIASSLLANVWLIYKKNDAWICWVIYSLTGIVLNIVIQNPFSTVLFCVFLLINGSACIAWIKMTDKNDYGWLGHEN